jgi:hypothetical protein
MNYPHYLQVNDTMKSINIVIMAEPFHLKNEEGKGDDHEENEEENEKRDNNDKQQQQQQQNHVNKIPVQYVYYHCQLLHPTITTNITTITTTTTTNTPASRINGIIQPTTMTITSTSKISSQTLDHSL